MTATRPVIFRGGALSRFSHGKPRAPCNRRLDRAAAGHGGYMAIIWASVGVLVRFSTQTRVASHCHQIVTEYRSASICRDGQKQPQGRVMRVLEASIPAEVSSFIQSCRSDSCPVVNGEEPK